MPLPIVTIVGRPNVGKSSLLNALARRPVAIVDSAPGVTRDRVSAILEHEGRWFELVDTGGMGLRKSEELAEDVERQIEHAIREATLVILVVDVRDGPAPLDREAADRLRRAGAAVIVAANKADTDRLAAGAADFYALGFDPVLATSAKHAHGRRELLDAIAQRLPAEAAKAPADVAMKLAIVGKRNAGKSTFINTLAGSERVIVSETPGTTRDAVDIRFEKDGLTYVAIDTAGVRKRRSVRTSVEFYSIARALASVRRADVILFLIDATVPISRVDKQLGAAIEKEVKPVVLVVNKWDLAVGRTTTGEFADYLARTLAGLGYAPISFTSAKDAKNVLATIDLARNLYKQAGERVTTSQLNRILEKTIHARRPPSPKGTPPKVYFATQVAVQPPTIVLSVNDPDLFGPDYRRYIENQFRESLPFPEVPIRLFFRAHREKKPGRKTPGESRAGRSQKSPRRPQR